MNIRKRCYLTTMGIPHYYKHIISTYKTIIKDGVPKCDRFYIDYNSVIHQCAAAVVSASPKYTYKDIIDNIIVQTDKLVSSVSPSQLVFIGIDGVAPRAKMVQQRKRRYITSFKNEIIKAAYERHLLPPPPDWDSNVITPGTPFMKELDIRLKDYFDTRKYPFQVILSGSSVPGEGEQKLFDHLRQFNDEKVNVINGLDADLIMLSLLSENKIYLQRDENTFVDMPEFRRCIAHHVNPETSNERLMWDYVFLCFLLGNDFIPNVPFLKIRNGGIDILVDIYKKVCRDFSENLVLHDAVNNEFTVNMTLLTEIIRNLSEMEQENLEYAVKQYNDTEPIRNFVPNIPEDCPKQLKRFFIELEQYPLIHRHPLTSSRDTSITWNYHYYEDFFGSHDPRMITKYSTQYIEGLVWVLNYYFNRKYDRFWCFKYPVSPLCIDLYKTLLMNDYQDRFAALQKDSMNIDITPDIQLLCVIPASSAKSLPPHLARIMTDPKYGCVDYYPTEFKLCTFMKRFLWECTPILPEIDIQRVSRSLSNSLLLKNNVH